MHEVPEFLGETALVDGFDRADGQGVAFVPAAIVAFAALAAFITRDPELPKWSMVNTPAIG